MLLDLTNRQSGPAGAHEQAEDFQARGIAELLQTAGCVSVLHGRDLSEIGRHCQLLFRNYRNIFPLLLIE